jgi:hypothetical protein
MEPLLEPPPVRKNETFSPPVVCRFPTESFACNVINADRPEGNVGWEMVSTDWRVDTAPGTTVTRGRPLLLVPPIPGPVAVTSKPVGVPAVIPFSVAVYDPSLLLIVGPTSPVLVPPFPTPLIWRANTTFKSVCGTLFPAASFDRNVMIDVVPEGTGFGVTVAVDAVSENIPGVTVNVFPERLVSVDVSTVPPTEFAVPDVVPVSVAV